MKKHEKFVPDGMRDLLFEETATRTGLQEKICGALSRRGYNRVETPSIEFFDLFNRESAGVTIEEMYKMSDKSGRLIVMRPDNTLPIARLVSTRLKDAPLPLRLFYNQSVMRQNPAYAGHIDEILQTGAELIGSQGLKADIEILSLAIESLTRENNLDFRIELGHAGFYKLVLDKLNADENLKEEITFLIESKNFPALDALLCKIENDCEAVEALRSLPTLFGDADVLKRAAEIFKDEEAYKILKYLGEVYDSLSELGFGGKISIDLGLVHRSSYYTGIIFRGYVEGSGLTALTGGRYDSLLGELGKDCPAVGFAVDLDVITSAVMNSGGQKEPQKTSVLVFGKELMEMKQQLHAKKLAENGIACECWLDDDYDAAVLYAKHRGIERIDVVSGGKVESVDL